MRPSCWIHSSIRHGTGQLSVKPILAHADTTKPSRPFADRRPRRIGFKPTWQHLTRLKETRSRQALRCRSASLDAKLLISHICSKGAIQATRQSGTSYRRPAQGGVARVILTECPVLQIRSWHFGDITGVFPDVCFRALCRPARHRTLTAEFDPLRTLSDTIVSSKLISSICVCWGAACLCHTICPRKPRS